MLPWLCGLRSDPETLEVAESGTWSDLSIAHRDRFAAIELEGPRALSDALVCRRRHDKYTVGSEQKLLLTSVKADVDSSLKE